MKPSSDVGGMDLSAMPPPGSDARNAALEGLLPVYWPRDPLAAQTKRFFERWLGDPQFRDDLAVSAVHRPRYDLAVSPDDMRYLWDGDYRQTLVDRSIEDVVADAPAASKQMFAWVQANHAYRRRLREDSRPTDPRFARWRQRQIARSSTLFRAAYDHNTPHIVAAVELSRGCSVGCWFCGVSAPKLDDIFLYTDENAHLLRGVLRTLRDVVGPRAARNGFLYWASDPFDNPDYERFCLDFEALLGAFPLSTTALPLKDVARTRAFVALAESRGAEKVRFSVSTLRQLNEIHATFSAEDLAIVDLITLNKGSLLQPSPTGRALDRKAFRPGAMSPDAVDRSISCVSGFLINMVERSVKLITPCNSSDRWPLGYYVYDQRRFEDEAHFRDVVRAMMDEHMLPHPSPRRPVCFRGDLAYEGRRNGFTLSTPHGAKHFDGNFLLREVGDLIASGHLTPDGIADCITGRYGIDGRVALDWIGDLFEDGLLDEEPVAA